MNYHDYIVLFRHKIYFQMEAIMVYGCSRSDAIESAWIALDKKWEGAFELYDEKWLIDETDGTLEKLR